MLLDDSRIIELYFKRDEGAIDETRNKYGKLLFHIADNILGSDSDAEECVDDTYMRTWQVIPPNRPNFFSAFLSKITRNLALTRYGRMKRRISNTDTAHIFEEISESVPDGRGSIADDIALRDALNSFLSSMGEIPRRIFMKRYFYMCDIKGIAREMGLSVSNVKVTLWRSRLDLREHLEKEGIYI